MVWFGFLAFLAATIIGCGGLDDVKDDTGEVFAAPDWVCEDDGGGWEVCHAEVECSPAGLIARAGCAGAVVFDGFDRAQGAQWCDDTAQGPVITATEPAEACELGRVYVASAAVKTECVEDPTAWTCADFGR